jgi:hypothetical protein
MTGGRERVVETVASEVYRREPDIAGGLCQRGDTLLLFALRVRMPEPIVAAPEFFSSTSFQPPQGAS